jgi:hypothetical protein
MIYLLERALRSTLTGLTFVERYGAITRAVPKVVIDEESGTTQNLFYPISYYSNVGSCFDSSKERELVPDDSYMSTMYWEHQGNSSLERSSKHVGFLVGKVRMRLVVWLNLPAMGFTDLERVDSLEMFTAKTLLGVHGNAYTVDFKKFQVNVDSITPVVRDEMRIFGKYFYSAKPHVFTYPNGFFALDCMFTLILNEACIEMPTLGAPINCITVW